MRKLAGTRGVQDVFNDATKVLFCGDLRDATETALEANPHVMNRRHENHSGLDSRPYDVPTWDPVGQDRCFGKVERYKNVTDPVNSFDGQASKSATWYLLTSWFLAHACDNIAKYSLSNSNSETCDWETHTDAFRWLNNFP